MPKIVSALGLKLREIVRSKAEVTCELLARWRSANPACGDATPSIKPLEWTGLRRAYFEAIISCLLLRGSVSSIPCTDSRPSNWRRFRFPALLLYLEELLIRHVMYCGACMKQMLDRIERFLCWPVFSLVATLQPMHYQKLRFWLLGLMLTGLKIRDSYTISISPL